MNVAVAFDQYNGVYYEVNIIIWKKLTFAVSTFFVHE